MQPVSMLDLIRGGVEAIAVAIWHMVLVLAGGPDGGVWRWVVVEFGMLVALLVAGGAVAATGLKVGGSVMPRVPMVRWIPAAIVALPFGTIWTAYAIMQSQAINVMMHPSELREVMHFTWGLPLVVTLPVYAVGGVWWQFAWAAAFGTIVVLLTGEVLAVLRGREQNRLMHAEETG